MWRVSSAGGGMLRERGAPGEAGRGGAAGPQPQCGQAAACCKERGAPGPVPPSPPTHPEAAAPGVFQAEKG